MPGKSTYLRLPTNDYAPNKNIRLGHVWQQPGDPRTAIGSPLPFPSSIIKHNYKTDWTVELNQSPKCKLGTRALIENFPVGEKNSNDCNHLDDGNFKFPIIESFSFDPEPRYLLASLTQASQKIRQSGTRFYMVTGVKVARYGERTITPERNSGVTSDIGGGTGTAVNVGANLESSTSTRNDESFSGTQSFVVAYRIREVRYKLGIMEMEPYDNIAVLIDGAEATVNIHDERCISTVYMFVQQVRLEPHDWEPYYSKVYTLVDGEGEEWWLSVPMFALKK